MSQYPNQYPPPYQPGGPVGYYGQQPGYPGPGYGGVPPQSGVGVASFVLSLIAGVIVLIAFAVIMSVVAKGRGTFDEDAPEVMTGGCGILASGIMALVGAILGLIGVNQADRRRGYAVAGLVINLILVLFLGVVMALGVASR
jgi:uncharacterized membrane protein